MVEEKENYSFGKIRRIFDWAIDIPLRIKDYYPLCAVYKKELTRANKLNFRNKDLEDSLMSLQEDNDYLQRKRVSIGRELGLLQENQWHLERKHEKLIVASDEERIELQTDLVYAQRDVEKKTEEILEIGYDVKNTLRVCHNVRTGDDVIEERAKENESANKSLKDWLECPKKLLEDRVRVTSEQSIVFQGFAFGGRVNTYMNQNPKAKKIPMAFFDFENKEFYYNSVAANLLNFNPKGSHLSLGKLLRIIKNESYECGDEKLDTKRKFLLDSLKSGEVLDGFGINTAEEKSRKVFLTTRPIHYASKVGGVTEKKHFGILMIFNKPFKIWDRKREKGVYEQVQKVLDNLEKDFEPIYSAVEDVR